jgi:hypothetical protein
MTHTDYVAVLAMISKTYLNSWDNSCQNNAQIIEIQQKIVEQELNYDFVL